MKQVNQLYLQVKDGIIEVLVCDSLTDTSSYTLTYTVMESFT